MARRGGSVRWLVALEGGLFALLCAKTSLAFPTSRLVYARGPGAEDCPDQAVVRDAVASRLGYDPFFPSSDKTIVARILRDERGLHGQVELVDEHGAQVGLRELTAEAGQCAELVRAMALSISIAIDPKSAETYEQGPPDEPQAAPAVPTVEPEPAATKPSKKMPAAPSVAPKAPPVIRAPRVLASLGVGAMGAFRDAPKLTLAGVAFARLRLSAWSAALEGRVDLPVNDEKSGVRFRTSSYALRAVPCLHVGLAYVCEVTSLGWLAAEGTDSGAKSGARALLSLGGRVGAELMLSRSIGLIGQAELLLSPWTVQLASEGHPLWSTPLLNGGAGFALAFHFL